MNTVVFLKQAIKTLLIGFVGLVITPSLSRASDSWHDIAALHGDPAYTNLNLDLEKCQYRLRYTTGGDILYFTYPRMILSPSMPTTNTLMFSMDKDPLGFIIGGGGLSSAEETQLAKKNFPQLISSGWILNANGGPRLELSYTYFDGQKVVTQYPQFKIERMGLEEKCATVSSIYSEPITNLSASVSSALSSGYNANKLTDRNDFTYWVSARNSHTSDTIVINLNATYSLTKLKINWLNSTTLGKTFSVYASTDGIGYSAIALNLTGGTNLVSMAGIDANQVKIVLNKGNTQTLAITGIEIEGVAK